MTDIITSIISLTQVKDLGIDIDSAVMSIIKNTKFENFMK